MSDYNIILGAFDKRIRGSDRAGVHVWVFDIHSVYVRRGATLYALHHEFMIYEKWKDLWHLNVFVSFNVAFRCWWWCCCCCPASATVHRSCKLPSCPFYTFRSVSVCVRSATMSSIHLPLADEFSLEILLLQLLLQFTLYEWKISTEATDDWREHCNARCRTAAAAGRLAAICLMCSVRVQIKLYRIGVCAFFSIRSPHRKIYRNENGARRRNRRRAERKWKREASPMQCETRMFIFLFASFSKFSRWERWLWHGIMARLHVFHAMFVGDDVDVCLFVPRLYAVSTTLVFGMKWKMRRDKENKKPKMVWEKK